MFGVGSLFGIICTVCFIAEWKLVPEGGQVKMAYHELIAILLTGIGVILAALALFIGALAVWGYTQFQSMTRSASAEHLEKMLREGSLKKEIEDIIVNHVSAQMSDGKLRGLLEERVDMLLMTNAGEGERDEGDE